MDLFQLCLIGCFISVTYGGLTTPTPPSDIHLTASTNTIHPSLTKPLTITCSFLHHQASEVSALMSLILAKTPSAVGTQYTDLATVTVTSPGTIAVKDDLGAKVTGTLSMMGNSTIVYEWTHAGRSAEGKYRCTAHGLNHVGHSMMTSADAVVEEQSVNLQMLLEKLQSLELDLADTRTELNDTTSRLTDTNSKLNDTTIKLTATNSKLNDTTTKLTATNSKLNDTTTKLTATNSKLNDTTTKLTATNSKLNDTTTKLTATNSKLNDTTIKLTATNSKLNATTTKLTSTRTELADTTNKLQTATIDLNATKLQLQSLANQQMTSHQEIVDLQQKKDTHVMLTAALYGDHHYTDNQAVVFSHLITSVGGGYNNSTGVFTVPVAGYYVTAIHAVSQTDKRVYLYIKHNGRAVAYAFTSGGAGTGNEAASNSVDVLAQQGDTISVVSSRDSYLYSYGYPTTFTVHLVSTV